MTPFNSIFYFNICHVTVCNILPFPSWQIFNLVFHRQVIKSRVLSVKKRVFNIESIKINAGCLTVSNIFTPLSLQSSILAYAAHCQTDSEGRPLAGTMIICRETLSMEKYTHEHFVQVTVSVFEKSELLKNRNIEIAFALCRQWSMSCSTCWASVKSSSADGRIVLSPLRVGNTALIFLNVLYVNG